jgi:hypothetical protein
MLVFSLNLLVQGLDQVTDGNQPDQFAAFAVMKPDATAFGFTSSSPAREFRTSWSTPHRSKSAGASAGPSPTASTPSSW